jgi:hypothetical protein
MNTTREAELLAIIERQQIIIDQQQATRARANRLLAVIHAPPLTTIGKDCGAISCAAPTAATVGNLHAAGPSSVRACAGRR